MRVFARNPKALLRGLQIMAVGTILFMLTAFLFAIWLNSSSGIVQATPAKTAPKPVFDSPNVVANGTQRMGHEIGRSLGSAQTVASTAAGTVAYATAVGSKKVASGIWTGVVLAGRGVGSAALATAKTIGSTASAVGKTVGSGAIFVARTPGRVLGLVSEKSGVSTFIRPADHAEDVHIIDPKSPELYAALAALPADEKANKNTKQKGVKPQWPIRGRVTTEFGVDHWPYQHTHTGIDISDRSVPGTTPVRPFRPGKVIKVVHSRSGLGNHVIIDHGSSVTSVYAHLNSIAVSTGQKVSQSTELGREGTTGVSTGTHLHFEIRVDGQAANPRKFIAGNP